MKRLSLGTIAALVVLAGGCGARPDLLEQQEGVGAATASGGSANGGAANGGSANGGAANGGAANGGAANGGAANGGAANGGSPNGGSAVGGAGNGGVAGNGGNGGAGNGGVGGNGGNGGAGNGGVGGNGGNGGAGNGGVGGNGGNGGAGGGMICPGLGDKCTDCLSTGCPERYCNCYDNKDCFALFTCASKCGGDMNCLDGCYQQHSSAFSIASLLTDCAATTCQAACPGNNQPLTPCNSCILESCDKEMNSCVADGNCIKLYQCLTSCDNLDLTCQDACYKKYPGSIMVLQALLQCTQNDCKMPCQQ